MFDARDFPRNVIGIRLFMKKAKRRNEMITSFQRSGLSGFGGQR